MPSFPIASRTYAGGERFASQAVTVPNNLVQARITLGLSVAQMLDPATNVEGRIEWAPQGTADNAPDWKLVGFTRLAGNPANNTSKQPYVEISPSTMDVIRGQLTRGVVLNLAVASITFGATLVVS